MIALPIAAIVLILLARHLMGTVGGRFVVLFAIVMLLLVLASGGAALDRDGYHSTLNRINTQFDNNRAGFCRTHPNAC